LMPGTTMRKDGLAGECPQEYLRHPHHPQGYRPFGCGGRQPRAVNNKKVLLRDGELFCIGDIKIECMRVPGHTWGHMVYIGFYSLCFPYYIAGKGRYAILLERRNTPNTCHNLLQRGKCALNFNTDDRAYFKEAVRFGFPGPSKEKMKESIYHGGWPERPYRQNPPQVIAEAYQVFECGWNSKLENAGRFSVEDIDDGPPAPTMILTALPPSTVHTSSSASIRF